MQYHLKVGETGEVNYLIISLKTVVLCWFFFPLCSLVVFALWSAFSAFSGETGMSRMADKLMARALHAMEELRFRIQLWNKEGQEPSWVWPCGVCITSHGSSCLATSCSLGYQSPGQSPVIAGFSWFILPSAKVSTRHSLAMSWSGMFLLPSPMWAGNGLMSQSNLA